MLYCMMCARVYSITSQCVHDSVYNIVISVVLTDYFGSESFTVVSICMVTCVRDTYIVYIHEYICPFRGSYLW